MITPRLMTLMAMILGAAAFRLLPHPPNFTPIGAMALLGGACFADKRLAFIVPLTALLLSDLVLALTRYGAAVFGGQMAFVYASFAFIGCIGLWLRHRRRTLPIAGAALAGSTLFFVVTNFGVWATGALYPRTAAGLVECYVAALPFFRNTLLGDVCYAALLFGGFALAEKRFPVLREPPVVHARAF
jgi:hypothetical protein